MRKVLMLLAMVVLFAPLVFGATLDFDRVTTYTDGTNIPAAKVPTIQYRGYSGPSSTGPWTPAGLVTDNLAIAAPDPAAGATLWYTLDASLDGMTSAKAAALSKTIPFPTPAGPVLRDVR